jgi:hypothetical protein
MPDLKRTLLGLVSDLIRRRAIRQIGPAARMWNAKVPMHEVTVRRESSQQGDYSERLIALLATGVQRLLEKRAVTLDFGADESVTTTCPDAGEEE